MHRLKQHSKLNDVIVGRTYRADETTVEIFFHVRNGDSVVRTFWSGQAGHDSRQIQFDDLTTTTTIHSLN